VQESQNWTAGFHGVYPGAGRGCRRLAAKPTHRRLEHGGQLVYPNSSGPPWRLFSALRALQFGHLIPCPEGAPGLRVSTPGRHPPPSDAP
jgi:hypothetical protein